MDVGQDTASSDGPGAKELVELLVVACLLVFVRTYAGFFLKWSLLVFARAGFLK